MNGAKAGMADKEADGVIARLESGAVLRYLIPADLSAIRSLHDHVRESLPPEEKSFILPRSESYFADHFARGAGSAMIGVETPDGILAAKCVILHPEENADPATLGGAIMFSPPERTSIMQAATVHPDHQGRGMMQAMLRHWLGHARTHDRAHVMAEIEIHNQKSWSLFLRAGLNIIRVGRSPVDGAEVYSAQERIKYGMGMELDPRTLSEDEICECATGDIENQRILLERGYQVVVHDRARDCLILKKPHS
jgi:RimJ/RimL family protein N-acetyltransferase